MRVDHLSFAAGPDGLRGTADRLSQALGTDSLDGGFHPRFGTRNRLIPLRDGRYVEVVEVLDHPAAESAPYGQIVRARSEAGGGWMGWVVSVDDLSPFEERLGRPAVPGSRHLPDGRLLEWRQVGTKGTMADPQLPFFLKWVSEPSVLPSALDSEIRLTQLDIAGDRARLEDWLGGSADSLLEDLEINWLAPNGQPGILAAHFETPSGTVSL
ncbi:VOC family protein [Naumannella halotolerans]|uniref:Glyoxalase-like protein n=1 Tax=Naumannella halotolerans TaxID=993414 RepID=A0A4R7IZ40_9ACTN|nr:VOC family protein [Naumannella halotolerans]TDT29974.1 glyoxalase-like protein [Naumannella halotolerans]